MQNIKIKYSLLAIFTLLTLVHFSSCQEGRFKQGKVLYDFHCAGCHMEDGTGLVELYPPLNGSDWLMLNKEQLPAVMRYGIEGDLMVNGIKYTIPMSGIPELSAVEISNISNYILSAWTNKLGGLSFEEVQKSLTPSDSIK